MPFNEVLELESTVVFLEEDLKKVSMLLNEIIQVFFEYKDPALVMYALDEYKTKTDIILDYVISAKQKVKEIDKTVQDKFEEAKKDEPTTNN